MEYAAIVKTIIFQKCSPENECQGYPWLAGMWLRIPKTIIQGLSILELLQKNSLSEFRI